MYLLDFVDLNLLNICFSTTVRRAKLILKKILFGRLTFFFFFFYVRNDSARYVEYFAVLFFGNGQFFLKFSISSKKSDFERFLCFNGVFTTF